LNGRIDLHLGSQSQFRVVDERDVRSAIQQPLAVRGGRTKREKGVYFIYSPSIKQTKAIRASIEGRKKSELRPKQHSKY
jgi:hypothetical protein